MRTLEEINRGFRFANALFTATEQDGLPRRSWEISEAQQKGSSIRRFLIYISILVVFVIGLTLFAKTVGGISWFCVESSSMQREIPQGSLVVIRRIDPNIIQVGDTITYKRNGGGTITHKVVDIVDTDRSLISSRGFRTQGVENERPDPEIVLMEHVVGVAIFHIIGAGGLLKTSSRLIPVILMAAFILVAFFVRRSTYKKDHQTDILTIQHFGEWVI